MRTRRVNWQTVLTVMTAGILGVFAAPRSAAAQAPSGSYQRSCRDGYLSRDGVLRAECRAVAGVWRRTSIRVADCDGRDIVSSNGQLACGDRLVGVTNNSRPRGRGRGRWGHAGRERDYGRITLFTDRRFRGDQMEIDGDYSNLGNTGFNDKTSSVAIQGGGTWRLCSDKNYGGKCADVTSSVSDLQRIGLGNRISSVRRID